MEDKAVKHLISETGILMCFLALCQCVCTPTVIRVCFQISDSLFLCNQSKFCSSPNVVFGEWGEPCTKPQLKRGTTAAFYMRH